jgi:hypothetical protein
MRTNWLPILLLLATALHAQCPNHWQQQTVLDDIAGSVFAVHYWDPDGAGPAPESMVVAGAFTFAGGAAANNIALLDPVSGEFSALGDGTDGRIFSLSTAANGDLIAAGEFAMAGGTLALHVARWNGQNWSAIGNTLLAPVAKVAALDNGDLIATGSFFGLIARWDGSSWQNVSLGLPGLTGAGAITPLDNGGYAVAVRSGFDGYVFADDGTGSGPQQVGGTIGANLSNLVVAPGGELLITGFDVLGSFPFQDVATFDGNTWVPFPALDAGPDGVARMANGDLLFLDVRLSGQFQTSELVRWDGVQAVDLNAGPESQQMQQIAVASDGRIAAFNPLLGMLVFDGTSWQSVVARRGPSGPVEKMTSWNGDTVVVGDFFAVDNIPARQVARLVDGQWQTMGAEVIGGTVRAIDAIDGGELFLAGSFDSIAGTPTSFMARYDGSQWHAFGGSVDNWVNAIAATPSGEAFFGGYFTSVDGQLARHIVRWDGTQRTEVGGGVDGPVFALELLPNGDLLVGGDFDNAGGQPIANLALWDGMQWSAVGNPDATVRTIFRAPSGEVLISGDFQTVGGVAAAWVASWNGTSWSSMSNGEVLPVTEFAALPDGDIIAAGTFTPSSGGPAAYLARWDGSMWSALPEEIDGRASSVLWRPDGRLLVGGNFLFVGALPSPLFASLEPSCPAPAEEYGAGCNGSAGPVTLTTIERAWTGGSLRAVADGLPPLSICLAVYGTQTAALPLPTVAPFGASGCQLLSTADILIDALLGSGSLTTAVAIPNSAPLVGAQFHHQVAPLELDTNGSIVELTSSNGVRATIGSF